MRLFKWGIGALVILPFLAASMAILWQGVPDVLLDGDGALIEIATRAVFDGSQLTGPYSREGFNHPGPMYFYLLAPFYWLTKGSASSLTLTVLLINALAILGILTVLWRCAERWTYLWCALLLMYYIKDWGPIFLSIWNPFVNILAFLCAIFCFSAVAAGRANYLALAVCAASFVVQTHLGYAAALLAAAIFALLLFGFPALRTFAGIKSATRGNVRQSLILSGVLLVILWSLPVIEQCSATPGNFSKIFKFFTTSSSEHSWQEVYRVACGIFTNFASSAVGALNFWEPSANSGERLFLQEPIPGRVHVLVWGQGLLLAAAYMIAHCQQQTYFTALALLCSVLYLATVFSLKGIVGPMLDYFLIWMTGLGLLNWCVVGSVCLPALVRKLPSVRRSLCRWLALAVTGALLMALSIGSSRAFFNTAQQMAANRLKATHSRDLDQVAARLLDFLQRTGATHCVLQLPDLQLWPALAGLALKMNKNGLTVAVEPQWPANAYPQRYSRSTMLPDAVFWVCTPEAGRRLQKIGNLEVIAETSDYLVVGRVLTEAVEGFWGVELLPAYALTYQGFSGLRRVNGHVFRWSRGEISTLRIRLVTGAAYRVTVTAAIPRNVKVVQVSLNGHPLTTLTFPGEWQWREFSMQLPGAQVNTLNELTFQYAYLTPPENPRSESEHGSLVAFESMAFEKIGPDQPD